MSPPKPNPMNDENDFSHLISPRTQYKIISRPFKDAPEYVLIKFNPNKKSGLFSSSMGCWEDVARSFNLYDIEDCLASQVRMDKINYALMKIVLR